MSQANNEDQRKRALDAISRRSLALAEAEVRQQQPKKTKRADEGNKIHSLVNSSTEKTKPSRNNLSSKKGNIAFSGHYSMQDVDLGGPTYLQLSHSVHENLLNASPKTSDERGGGGTAVSDILHDLLQKGDSAHKYMHGSKSMKIDSCILLDNLVHGGKKSLTAPIRQLKIRSMLTKKVITSMKQQKKCGALDLPPELRKYDIFKPMHEMWMGYMMQLLKNVGKNQLPQCLLTADLHGAIILVVQCKITPFIGVSGIMIRETAETFGILTEENNKFRVVPKKHSVFVLQVDCWKITLVGDQLISRTI